jgi:PAS domain-containing protein
LRHFNAIGVLEFGPDGKVATVLTITHDITQRKLTLEALRKNEERLQIALDAARLGAWELDLTTGRMECSPQCKANFGRLPQSDLTYADFQISIHQRTGRPRKRRSIRP